MKIKAIVFSAIFTIAFGIGLQAQDNMWKTLAKVTYKKEYDEMLGFKVDVPIFSEELKKMEKRLEETIKGKNKAIDDQAFEVAASLRDQEKFLQDFYVQYSLYQWDKI